MHTELFCSVDEECFNTPPTHHEPGHTEQATFWGCIILFPVWYILPQPWGANSIITSSSNFLWSQTEAAPWSLPALSATLLVTLRLHLPRGVVVICILWVRASTWIWGWGVGVENNAAHNISLSGMCCINSPLPGKCLKEVLSDAFKLLCLLLLYLPVCFLEHLLFTKHCV